MMDQEDIDHLGVPRGLPLAYPQTAYTWDQAAKAAKNRLCAIAPYWCTASLQEVATKVCTSPDLFTGSNTGNEDILIRCGLKCPLPTQTCPAPPPPTGDNTMLILGLAAVAAVGVVAFTMAQKGKKKIIVARVAK